LRTTTYLGLAMGVTVLLLAIRAKGGDVTLFTNTVALLVCLGGTLAATTLSSSRETIVHAFSALARLFVSRTPRPADLAEHLVQLARKARADGLTSIDPDKTELRHRFLVKGLRLVVDGVEAERIESLLRLESDVLSEKRRSAERMFRLMGTYSPMFGLIGTLVGLIQMLKGLTDPRAIGHGISVALMATFYGVLLAGLVFLPLSGKVKTLDVDERLARDEILAGLLAIRRGENPEYVRETLEAFVQREREA
jgi:chemotaxis protein MotA